MKEKEHGLSEAEAKARLERYGTNRLPRARANALWVFLRQLKSSLVYLLVAAAAIAFWTHDAIDGTVIAVILTLNTALGFYQEYKSERIVEKLSQYITRQARVKRNGEFILIDESFIVPGDVISLHEGDIVPADIKLTTVDGLLLNESQLTGESVPIAKLEGDRVFTGSVVEKGEGMGIVYATGPQTEFGNIAALTTQTRKETPYEKSLQSFSSLLVRATLAGLLVVFVLKVLLTGGIFHGAELLLFMIATAVAVVPEVLPVIATVSLSSGSYKMAQRSVVVKRLSAIEDFGNINLLCTDKTGTLTENKMTVQHISSSDDTLFQTLAYAVMTPLKHHKRRTVGSYDEAFEKHTPAHLQAEAKHWRIVKEIPFDPEARRRRIVLQKSGSSQTLLVVVGAPDTLLHIAHTSHSEEYRKTIAHEGAMGLHHISIAYKEITHSDNFDIIAHEHGLHFLGYAALFDPLRPTAKHTIHHAEQLGIEIKILSGDSREVSEYIGRQVGLVTGDGRVYVGDELEAMNPEQFKEVVFAYSVFARVSPAQKYKIIQALKERYVVGYQGDGINDAPALKLADVAIAVNTATDIAKESADVVLLKRNLEVIIEGIKYGRSIFVNINKYINYTMVNNVGNFITLCVLYLIATDLPMLPIQILLTSMITDIPLIAISSDTVETNDVARPEKHDVRVLMALPLVLGLPTALFELGYFYLVRSQPLPVIQTSMYVFFSAITFIIFFVVRNREHFWKTKLPSKTLTISFVLAAIASLAMVYIQPFQAWFSFVPVSVGAILFVMVLMLTYLFVCDFIKVQYFARRTVSV